jgi:hypothetical protein
MISGTYAAPDGASGEELPFLKPANLAPGYTFLTWQNEVEDSRVS